MRFARAVIYLSAAHCAPAQRFFEQRGIPTPAPALWSRTMAFAGPAEEVVVAPGQQWKQCRLR
eukprot:5753791-Lingulodinium_polyedra.AAC.1